MRVTGCGIRDTKLRGKKSPNPRFSSRWLEFFPLTDDMRDLIADCGKARSAVFRQNQSCHTNHPTYLDYLPHPTCSVSIPIPDTPTPQNNISSISEQLPQPRKKYFLLEITTILMISQVAIRRKTFKE